MHITISNIIISSIICNVKNLFHKLVVLQFFHNESISQFEIGMVQVEHNLYKTSKICILCIVTLFISVLDTLSECEVDTFGYVSLSLSLVDTLVP